MKKRTKHSSHSQTKAKHAKDDPPMKLTRLVLIILLVILALLVGFLLLTGRSQKPASLTLSPQSTPTRAGLMKAPPPHLILPQGKQEFQIRSGAGNTPVGTKIVADPLDAPKNTQQTISLDVEYTKPIDSVNAIVITDTMEKTYPMNLTAGTNQKGTWTGTWTMADDHENIFTIKFVIGYNGKQSVINFPIR